MKRVVVQIGALSLSGAPREGQHAVAEGLLRPLAHTRMPADASPRELDVAVARAIAAGTKP
jgi:hypothetical protein